MLSESLGASDERERHTTRQKRRLRAGIAAAAHAAHVERRYAARERERYKAACRHLSGPARGWMGPADIMES